jgi:hypothetical protein
MVPHADQTTIVPGELLLLDMAKARVCANEMLKTASCTCFAEVRRTLLGQASALTTIDRSFTIELDFLRDGAEQALAKTAEKKLLELLPSIETVVPIADVLTKVVDFRRSKFAAMCSHAAQGQMDCVKELISNMMRGISPDIGPQTNTDDFFAKVLARLATFARLTPKGKGEDEDKPQVELVGKAAVSQMFADMAERMLNSNDAQLGELEVFQCYRWLLTSEQLKQLGEWVKKSLQLVSAATQDRDFQHHGVL